MAKYRTLKDFPSLPAGSVGDLVENDFPKYDVKLQFPEVDAVMPISKKKFKFTPTLYFYRDEVEEVS